MLQGLIQFIPVRLLINGCAVLGVTSLSAQTHTDSIPTDAPLKTELFYKAKDSIRFDLVEQKIYLFGDAEVNYEGIKLNAGYIEYGFSDNLVYASETIDSTGKSVGKPVFDDGSQKLSAREIRYNIQTKKGNIRDVKTQQGEGYVHMGVAKKHPDNEVHLQHGKYTTCDLDHPHFYFNLRKAIVIPDDKIVSGPVNLVIADIPTPLMLPFGFFPNKKGEASGLVVPTYGESPELGFFLLNGGYYFPIGKKGKADMQVLGDIYSRGSWGLRTINRYANRYKYRGDLNLSYSQLNRGDPEFPDFSRNQEFFIRWRHEQDAKAHPYRRFSANVNAGTTQNFRNNFNTDLNTYLTNTFQSNIAYSYSFPNKPFTMSANLRHSQNSVTRVVNVILPELTFNMLRIYPFARKNPVGAKKWYEQIGVTYNTQFKNDLTVADSLIRMNDLGSLTDRMRYGMRHSAVAATSFKILKQKFTFNPSVSFTERWYMQTIERAWDNDLQAVVTDTINGFSRIHEYNFNGSLTTKLFGFYAFQGARQTRIRHVFTPALNFTYRPDFGSLEYGYVGNNGAYGSYSPFENGIYGRPAEGQSGMVRLDLVNNLEMKFKSAKDTVTGFKKVILIENFTTNLAYDMFRDSLNWSNLTLSGRTTLWRNLGLVYNGVMDPYQYENGIARNKLMISDKKGLGRFTSNAVALTWNLRSKQSTRSKPRHPDAEAEAQENDPAYLRNSGAYVDFTVPWMLNLSYTMRSDRYFINAKDTTVLTQAIVFDGDFLLTEKWKIGFRSGYDFVAKTFTPSEINLYRDLHCWEMRFTWIPFGFRKSYMLQINIKSSMLRDLKMTRRRSWFDNVP